MTYFIHLLYTGSPDDRKTLLCLTCIHLVHTMANRILDELPTSYINKLHYLSNNDRPNSTATSENTGTFVRNTVPSHQFTSKFWIVVPRIIIYIYIILQYVKTRDTTSTFASKVSFILYSKQNNSMLECYRNWLPTLITLINLVWSEQ